MEEKNVKIMLVKGVGGYSLYINEYRVAGSKPLGGGTTIQEWNSREKDILEALKQIIIPNKENKNNENNNPKIKRI